MVRNHAYVMMKLRQEQKKEFCPTIFLSNVLSINFFFGNCCKQKLNIVHKKSQCLPWYRRRLRPKDVDKLINMIPDLYRSIQQEKNRSGQILTFFANASEA